MFRIRWASAALGLVTVGSAYGGVIEFGNRDEWISAVGSFTTIDFTGFPDATVVSGQYSDIGVHFTDANDQIRFGPTIFPIDEWGLDGNGDIRMSFDAPQLYLAVDFPGILYVELYSEGQLINTTNAWGSGGVGWYFGFLSSEPFDALRIIDPVGGVVFLDDVHFGVPAPGALPALGLSLLLPRRQRKWSAS